jgi:E3 ubiquitin-protein ligase RNF115/126
MGPANTTQLQAHFDMLAEDGGAPGQFPTGRFGDYVMTEDGYNDILERLMQAAGPQGPLPATDAVIEGLPRFSLDVKALGELFVLRFN